MAGGVADAAAVGVIVDSPLGPRRTAARGASCTAGCPWKEEAKVFAPKLPVLICSRVPPALLPALALRHQMLNQECAHAGAAGSEQARSPFSGRENRACSGAACGVLVRRAPQAPQLLRARRLWLSRITRHARPARVAPGGHSIPGCQKLSCPLHNPQMGSVGDRRPADARIPERSPWLLRAAPFPAAAIPSRAAHHPPPPPRLRK